MGYNILFRFLLLFIGIVCLAFSSNWLIAGASSLAKKIGIPSLIVGLTVVAIGTSSPEIVTSCIASFKGNPNIALGNVLGSNIANIGLIIGITATFIPLTIKSSMLKKEFPILFGCMLLVGIFMLNKNISRIDGLILLVVCIMVITGLTWYSIATRKTKGLLAGQYSEEISTKEPTIRSLFKLTIGLAVLLASADTIVNNAVIIANHFKISNLIIGLTLLSIGTSLPELAISITGAIKKEYDLVVGNILGSNIFNLLLVLPLASIIKPIPVSKYALLRDFTTMVGITGLLYFLIYYFRRTEKLNGFGGSVLLLSYASYLLILFFIHAPAT